MYKYIDTYVRSHFGSSLFSSLVGHDWCIEAPMLSGTWVKQIASAIASQQWSYSIYISNTITTYISNAIKTYISNVTMTYINNTTTTYIDYATYISSATTTYNSNA